MCGEGRLVLSQNTVVYRGSVYGCSAMCAWEEHRVQVVLDLLITRNRKWDRKEAGSAISKDLIPVSYFLMLLLPHKAFTVLPKQHPQLEMGALMLESVSDIIFFFIKITYLCVYVYSHVPWWARRKLSPFTMWALGIELKSSGLAPG